jgi:hypothetical protein
MGQLLSVAISVILIWAVLIDLVGKEFLPIVGLWFLCTAVFSLMSGLINLRRGEEFNGVLQSFFGIFFFGGFALMFLYGPDKGIDFTPLLGYVHIPLGIILSAFTVGVWRASKIVGISLIFFDVGLLVMGVLNLAERYSDADLYGGWLIGIAGFIMLFAGLALVISTALGKKL